MIDPSTPDVRDETKQNNHPARKDSLTELRRLLVGPEQEEINNLRERLRQQEKLLPEDVSRVLPEAVTLRSRQDKKVTEALLPAVEEAIDISVKKNPQTLIDALFPVMGPAIRKAIAEALSGMTQAMNKTLEHSLSPQGLKWRIEAWRTGRSFAEVVMLHTLLYRVEQVFLIHKETGLMLQHVVAGDSGIQDADMVSGMLTAIQDFVQDSFGTEDGGALDTLQVGELAVWIERGPHAVLAAVIRGNAPQDLRSTFQSTLEQIHQEFAHELEVFEGDAAPFEPSRKYLEACLQSQYEQHEREKAQKRVTPIRVIAAVFLLAILVSGFFYARSRWRWNNYLTRLKSEPGVVITNAERQWGNYSISGLRDPLASDPHALLNEAKLDPDEVESHWEPYHSLTPQFVLQRAKALLNPPASLTLTVKNNVLYAFGSASHQWIVEARKLVRVIPGLESFDEANLTDTNVSELLAVKRGIEGRVIRFVLDTTALAPGQNDELEALSSEIKKLNDLAPAAGKRVSVAIIGHTDQLGTEEKNLRLSRDRADGVRAMLAQRLGETLQLTVVGIGSKEPVRVEQTDEDKEANRSVTVKITITDIS
jgi:OOP family OmpA-OmpF porin